jgi:GntR family transcriptional regulator
MMENILRDKWKDQERIPSVRDLATTLAVNPNTVVRSYSFLEGKGIICNQRGIGYFLAPGAKQMVINFRTEALLSHQLPRLFDEMQLLGLSLDDIATEFEKYKLKTTSLDERTKL